MIGARALSCGAAALALAAGLGAQETRQGRPDLEPARIGGEVIVGSYVGVGGFLIGRFIGGSVGNLLPASERDRNNMAQVTGLLAGGAATAGGVYAIGMIGDQTGSYPAALLGAGAGYLTGVAITRLVFRGRGRPSSTPDSRMRWTEAAIESLLPALGATIAFNSSRRFK